MSVPASAVTSWSWPQIVAAIQSEGQLSGLSQDQINAALTVAAVESGQTTTAVNPTSGAAGIFQFYGTPTNPGQLNNFAAWLYNVPTSQVTQTLLNQAAQLAVSEPALAIQFALQDGGYLWNALQAGAAKGNSGLNLALYAEQFGQVPQWTAQAVASVTSWWLQLFGSVVAPPSPPVGSSPPPSLPPVVAQPPLTLPGITLPNFTTTGADPFGIAGPITNVANAIGAVPGALLSVVMSIERFFWIVIGLVIAGIGLWILVEGEPKQVINE